MCPSVLWRCWLDGRKDIWPVKKLSGGVWAWLSVWSKVQMICMWSKWCHCHPIISCFVKTQNGYLFRSGLPMLSWKKRLLNGCSVAVVVLLSIFYQFLIDFCCILLYWPLFSIILITAKLRIEAPVSITRLAFLCYFIWKSSTSVCQYRHFIYFHNALKHCMPADAIFNILNLMQEWCHCLLFYQ